LENVINRKPQGNRGQRGNGGQGRRGQGGTQNK
jgi:hypothetical protein